ncbi:MAG: hypothetical protein HRU10_10465 [Opitutales bacterium]|nr:hypothetical protein [Opitutales bacterium]
MRPFHLLVVTPTLGKSTFFEETLASLDRARSAGVRLTHVIACPGRLISEIASVAQNSLVVDEGESCRSMYDAINSAVAQTNFDWSHFTYINDGDYFSKFFANFCNILDDQIFDIAYGLVDLVDESSEVISPIPICRKIRHLSALWKLGKSPFTQQGTVVSREFYLKLGGFDGSYKYAADMDFWCRAINHSPRYYFHPESVAAFRLVAGQLSADRTDFDSETIMISNKLNAPSLFLKYESLAFFYADNISRYLKRFSTVGFRRGAQLYDA